MRRLLLSALTVPLLALAACSDVGGTDSSESGPAETTWSTGDEDQAAAERTEGQVSEEEAAVVDVIEIEGAQVEGDTARVTAESFGGTFAEGFSDADIVLQRLAGEWYVDLQRSDLGSSSR